MKRYVDSLKAKDKGYNQYPTWPDHKSCGTCLHWITHGKGRCALSEKDYCRAHGKCYWRHFGSKDTSIPDFITKDDFEL